MKRYWRLILLVTVIVVTFGTLYIQSTFAFTQLPKFKIVHEDGDPSEIDQLAISGLYIDENTEAYLEFEKGKANYRKYPSYIDQLTESYYPPEITQLQKEYRNFMRAKQENPNSFFHNDDFLIYAHINIDYRYYGNNHRDFTFEIETLDKRSKEKNKFILPVPEPEKYDFLYLTDVQLTEHGELKLISNNHLAYNYDDYDDFHYQVPEIHVYTFDLDKQILVNDEVIQQLEMDVDENINYEVSDLPSESSVKSKEYIVFSSAIREVQPGGDGYHFHEELIDLDIIIYDLETGDQWIPNLPEEIDEEFSPDLYIDSTIYFMKYSGDQIEVIKFNFISEEIESKQAFDLKTSHKEPTVVLQSKDYHFNTNINYGLKDDKVYIVSAVKTNKNDAFIQVGDIESGEILYEGKIETESQHKIEYGLELYTVEVKN